MAQLIMKKPEELQWRIWSHEHQAWWGPNQHGYCYSKANAGIYSFKEAMDIVWHANYGLKDHPHEAMVPVFEDEG